jgi:hypothetical protein
VSAERWLEPSERGRLDVSEACEGDVIHLGCPPGAVIQFAKKSYFHFGRGGPWEQNTSCGGTGGGGRSRAAANCTTVNGRRLVEAACGGRSACTVALRGRFPGADPCPVGSAALRKYFIFRYSCAAKDEEGKKRKGQWALGSSLSRYTGTQYLYCKVLLPTYILLFILYTNSLLEMDILQRFPHNHLQ